MGIPAEASGGDSAVRGGEGQPHLSDVLTVFLRAVFALHQLREQYRTFVAAFREAAARWKRGDFSGPFPLFSFPPRVVLGRVARIL